MSAPMSDGHATLGSVLVATNFTTHANDAALRAAWLPLAPGASISLVHALPELPPSVAKQVRGAAEALLQAARDSVAAERERARLPAVDLFPAVVVGPPAEAIAARARDENAELVVVGRGELRGAARLLGTTAERIVRACDRSVLVVSARPVEDYARPLLAVDLSPLSRRALELAYRVAPVRAMSGLLVHSLPSSFGWHNVPLPSETLRAWEMEEKQRAIQQLEHWIADNGAPNVSLRPCVRRGDIAATIVSEAERERVDLLVVGSRGHSTILHLTLGAVAERVLRRAACDVLVVR